MRMPPYIKPGDTIGFVAPSFGCVIEPYRTRFLETVRKMEERGYRTKIAPSCFKDDGIGISTDPAVAARETTEMYLDPEVSAVISAGGGELMCETISHIDFDMLAQAPPKWYMGYSDNTNFLFPMSVRGIAGIYGPCAPTLGKVWEAPEEDAVALLEGTKKIFEGYDYYELPEDGDRRKEDALAPYFRGPEKVLSAFVPAPAGTAAGPDASQSAETGSVSGGMTLRPAGPDETVRMRGTLLGGCLDLLGNLAGTNYDKTREFISGGRPVIWVMEACDLSVLDIRRVIWRLIHCGWFDTAAGFLVGRPLAAFDAPMMGVDRINAVTDMLSPLGVPVILDADVGHIAPMLPLVLGAKAEVTARGNLLRVAYL